MEFENNVKELKEEVKVYEREILNLLLSISKSFSACNMTRNEREESFKKIDDLREKVKDISKIIDDIEKRKYECVYKCEKEIASYEKEEDPKESIEENIKESYKLENIELIKRQQASLADEYNEDKNDGNISNIDTKYHIKEEIKEKEQDIELTQNEINDIDRVIDNMEVKTSDIEEEKEEKEGKQEGNLIEENQNFQDLGEEAIEKIDRLIKEAKELNNAVIKFPEEKVVRRNRSRQYENIDEIEENDEYISKTNLNFNYNNEDYGDQNYDIEPVPVLFGNRRVQNQMVVRKKSNGFSNKLKTLIFKIKVMLGGEDE